MSARQLTAAMDDYLAVLDALDRWQFDEGELKTLRAELATYRRRLLELLDAPEPAAGAEPRAAGRGTVRGGGRVLASVDDSDPGRWAVKVASNLAAAVGAEIVLVHVINPAVAATPDMPYLVADVRGQLLRRADDLLAAAHAALPAGIHAERVVREGDAGLEVVAAAREWEADVVVMGTRGRGRLASFLLGSTAETVVRQAHCPVVTVGHDPAGTLLDRTVAVGRGAPELAAARA